MSDLSLCKTRIANRSPVDQSIILIPYIWHNRNCFYPFGGYSVCLFNIFPCPLSHIPHIIFIQTLLRFLFKLATSSRSPLFLSCNARSLFFPAKSSIANFPSNGSFLTSRSVYLVLHTGQL